MELGNFSSSTELVGEKNVGGPQCISWNTNLCCLRNLLIDSISKSLSTSEFNYICGGTLIHVQTGTPLYSRKTVIVESELGKLLN